VVETREEDQAPINQAAKELLEKKGYDFFLQAPHLFVRLQSK
jgi:hypothetical protein